MSAIRTTIPEQDTDPFRAVVKEYGRRVFRVAYRITGNEQDAEDVVQETFMRAYRRYDRFESRARITSWLHTIATHAAIDLLRRRKRGRERDQDPLDSHVTLVSDGPDPERSVLGSEIHDRIRGGLAELSPKERAAFVLRHYEGMSIDEIGAKQAIVQAMFMHEDVQGLIEYYRKETDPELRNLALRFLSMIDSEEVRALMVEILEP